MMTWRRDPPAARLIQAPPIVPAGPRRTRANTPTTPDIRPPAADFAETLIPNQADRYRAGGTCSLAAVRSWVEPGSTGPVYTGNPAKIHHHLHVAPEGPGLARIPQVAARVRVALSHPVGADQGPVQADERLFRPAQPIQDLGKVWGPVRDHPQGPVAGTCRPWPGSPSSRGPGWSGQFPPPSTSAPAPPEPGRWPPWARASRHAPCGGPPSTGGWCGRWTRGWMTAPRGAFEKDLKNNEPFSPELAAQSRGSAWWCGKEWVWSGCGAHEGRTALHCLEPSRVITPILASPGALLVRKAQSVQDLQVGCPQAVTSRRRCAPWRYRSRAEESGCSDLTHDA